MKRSTTRLLSTLLVLCMVLALLPGTAWAAKKINVDYDSIDIFVKNRKVWTDMKGRDIVTGKYDSHDYGLFDLEGDGIPELFVSQLEGSGWFSRNYYFKIDTNTRSVYEIQDVPESLTYIDLTEKLNIYQDKQTDQLFYYSYDFARAGTGYYSVCYSFIYSQNGVASEKPLWDENHHGGSVEYYYYTDSGNKVAVSESGWKQYQEEYLKRYTLLSEEVPIRSSKDIDSAKDEKLSEILLEMYNELYQSLGATAYASTQTVDIDGEKVEFQMYALKDANGNDTNYIKIRDLALAMNGTNAPFSVDWDGSVKLTAGETYTPNGSENATPFSGNRSYTVPTDPTNVNGAPSDLQAILLKDDAGGGFTYYKLRDLGSALGFNVGWSAERGVFIESDKPYSE